MNNMNICCSTAPPMLFLINVMLWTAPIYCNILPHRYTYRVCANWTKSILPKNCVKDPWDGGLKCCDEELNCLKLTSNEAAAGWKGRPKHPAGEMRRHETSRIKVCCFRDNIWVSTMNLEYLVIIHYTRSRVVTCNMSSGQCLSHCRLLKVTGHVRTLLFSFPPTERQRPNVSLQLLYVFMLVWHTTSAI